MDEITAFIMEKLFQPMRALGSIPGHMAYKLVYTLILQTTVTLDKWQEFHELANLPKPAQITLCFVKRADWAAEVRGGKSMVTTIDVICYGPGKIGDVIYGCPFALVTFQQGKSQFYLQLVNKPHFETWILLFGQLRAEKKIDLSIA